MIVIRLDLVSCIARRQELSGSEIQDKRPVTFIRHLLNPRDGSRDILLEIRC
jgi:hypothetical protein